MRTLPAIMSRLGVLVAIQFVAHMPVAANLIKVTVKAEIITGHSGSLTYVRFSPDGSLIASAADSDLNVQIRRTEDGVKIADFEHERRAIRITAITFSPNGRTLATVADDGQVRVWSMATRRLATTRTFANTVTSITFAPDSAWIAVGTLDGMVALWNPQSNEMRPVVPSQGPRVVQRVDGLTYVAEGKGLLWSDNRRVIHRYDFDTASEKKSDPAGGLEKAWSSTPDGRYLVGAGHTFRLWNATDGRLLAEVEPTLENGRRADPRGILFLRGGKRLLAGFDTRVVVWSTFDFLASDVLAMSALVLERPTDDLFAVSRDGALIAAGNQFDAIIEIWRVDLMD